MNKTFKNTLYLGLLMIGVVVIASLIAVTIDYPTCTFNQPAQYKVYYEYDIINNDTIAVDTIYVKL